MKLAYKYISAEICVVDKPRQTQDNIYNCRHYINLKLVPNHLEISISEEHIIAHVYNILDVLKPLYTFEIYSR